MEINDKLMENIINQLRIMKEHGHKGEGAVNCCGISNSLLIAIEENAPDALRKRCSECNHYKVCKYKDPLHVGWQTIAPKLITTETFWHDLDQFVGSVCVYHISKVK